jgi:hypothetical protein
LTGHPTRHHEDHITRTESITKYFDGKGVFARQAFFHTLREVLAAWKAKNASAPDASTGQKKKQ